MLFDFVNCEENQKDLERSNEQIKIEKMEREKLQELTCAYKA